MKREDKKTAKKKNAVFEIIGGRKILTEYGKKVFIGLISFVLVLAIGLGTFFGVYYGSGNNTVDVSFMSTGVNKEIGEIKSETLFKKNYAYGVFYPETKIEAIDNTVKAQNETIISEFLEKYKDYKSKEKGKGAVLFCDYEARDYGKYIQILRKAEYEVPQEETTYHVYTVFYDTDAKKILKGSDVFDSTFKEFISSRISKELSDSTNLNESQISAMSSKNALNFDAFSFDKTDVYLYLDDEDNNTHTVKFSLDNSITSHLKIDIDAIKNAEQAMAQAEKDAKYKDYIQDNEFGKSITEGIDPTKPMVALTFDDGPDAENTKRILDVLEANNSVATFFVVGTMVDECPEMVKRAHEMGCEIANHTDDHDFLTYASDEEEYDSYVNKLNDRVKSLTGVAPTLLRPPGGDTDEDVLSYAKHPLIMWSVDTGDWASRNCDSIVNVVKGIEESGEVDLDGEIILMHDIYDTTADAVEILVPYLIEKGYQLVTVSDLLQCKKVELEKGKIYHNDTNNMDAIGDYSYDVSGYSYTEDTTDESTEDTTDESYDYNSGSSDDGSYDDGYDYGYDSGYDYDNSYDYGDSSSYDSGYYGDYGY